MVVAYQTVFGAIRHGKETTGESVDEAIKTEAQAESDENGSVNESATPKSEPVAKVEQILAAQYRKVVFKPLFSMDVRIASLQRRARWRAIGRNEQVGCRGSM